jgi:hypothetical protein
MVRWRLRRARPAGLVIAAAVVLLVTACGGPPRYQFASSAADDLVFKLPWGWRLLRSGAPVASDGTTATDGSWYAVYDADPHPDINHLNSTSTRSPVVLARTLVVDKSVGASVTDDQLRDVALPVSAAGRSAQAPPGAKFALMVDQTIRGRTERGVHDLYSYDFGQGPEVFDQIAVVDNSKTRVHLLVVHCTQSCFDANRSAILAMVASFTVKAP